MILSGIVKKGEYFDSVSIMLMAKELSLLKSVTESAVLMGTAENKSLLKESDLFTSSFERACDMDLLIAFKTEDKNSVKETEIKIAEFLSFKKHSKDNNYHPSGIEDALKIQSKSNLVLISVAGKYAGDLAKKSLENGLNVMLFSDNVSVEKEIELKRLGKEKELLVMGPDCGTAIINGVPLCFANVVNRGNIGVVAASGTGCQEVTCIISNSGSGISQAIGTGGRDVKKDVGGIMFLEAIKLLANDSKTDVILLVSKPPADEVIDKIKTLVKNINKPVVSVFLGASLKMMVDSEIHWATTLEEGALLSVQLANKSKTQEIENSLKLYDSNLNEEANELVKLLSPGQKFIRGLFSGGTFCDETLLLSLDRIDNLFSNVPFSSIQKLSNSSVSQFNTIVDLGDDEFTLGKPHPMIDYSTRCKRILAEAEDSETAVILFDIVLGFGSNMNPLDDILPAINLAKEIARKENRGIIFICSVTGTDNDPQNRSNVILGLLKSDVIVKNSNASASKLAIEIIQKINKNNYEFTF